MKKFALLTLIIVSVMFNLASIAQDSFQTKPEKRRLSEYLVFRLNFFSPSFEVEGLISKNKTTNTVLGEFRPGTYWTTEYEGGPLKLKIVPRLKAAYRIYYNVEKRQKKDKPTEKFAGNFLSIITDYAFRTEQTSQVLVFGPAWGLQRNWGGFFHFSMELGGGYVYSPDPDVNHFTFILNLRFGFTF
jgi:hypothetical protein